jgi:hypothetical protein
MLRLAAREQHHPEQNELGAEFIPELDILFVGEFDEEASPLGAKGLGELTAVSVAPAIANAVPGRGVALLRHLAGAAIISTAATSANGVSHRQPNGIEHHLRWRLHILGRTQRPKWTRSAFL